MNNELSCNSIIIYNILKFVNIDNIHVCSLINKEWYKVSNSNKIWELLFLRNIFRKNEFINEEKEIYSKGCLKQQFSNDLFKFKDLYKLCFQDHYNRYKYKNLFKNLEIISDDGNDQNIKVLPNIENFEKKLIKFENCELDDSDDFEIDEYIRDIINYTIYYKSSLKMTYDNLGERVCSFLLSSNKRQISKNGDFIPTFLNTFEYLICIPNKVDSVQDPNKKILEYTRFIYATFNINVAYNVGDHFINDGSSYSGDLLKDSTHSFELFDIDNPTFDEYGEIEFKEHEDNLDEDQIDRGVATKVSPLDLWNGIYDNGNQHMYNQFVSLQYLQHLNEFSRNKLNFTNKEFYLSFHAFNINFEFPNKKKNPKYFDIQSFKQLNNIEWKLKLYLNYKKNLSNFIGKNEKNAILQFIQNSTIHKFQKTNSIGYNYYKVETIFNFEFSIPYEDQILVLSINYNFGLVGHYDFYVRKNPLNFSITYKFIKHLDQINENKFNILYECCDDGENRSIKNLSIEEEKSLKEYNNTDDLIFIDFLSFLFKNKFPNFQFKFKSLLLLIELNKFISFSGQKGIHIPKISGFNDYF